MFVLLHSATMDAGGQHGDWRVVSGSGTGDLAGLSGRAEYRHDAKGAVSTLEYELAWRSPPAMYLDRPSRQWTGPRRCSQGTTPRTHPASCARLPVPLIRRETRRTRAGEAAAGRRRTGPYRNPDIMSSTEQPEKNSSPEPDEVSSAEFARALEQYEKERPAAESAAALDISPGMKVKGKVVGIGDEWLTIDFGGRSEGVAKAGAFKNEDGTLGVAVGDELDMFVVESDDQIVLATSLHPAGREAANQLREAKSKGMPVSGNVTGVNAGGLEVNLSGARGFCPMSQIETGFCEDPTVYVGRTLEFLVTSVEDGRGGAVLSRKKLLRRQEDARGRKLLKSLEPGQELDGSVARLEAFGAFVDLGGVDGLVHVSEIRHERVGHPNQVLKPGDKVRVKVLRLEKDKKGRRRIALSIKACAPDPWEDATEQFKPGMKVPGTVARLTDFGAFVTLAPGVDGLVHVSQAADHRIEHVREVLKPGDTVDVHVLTVDLERRRISLSIREPAEPPRATLDVKPGRPRRERGPRGRGQGKRERERDHEPAEKPRGPEEPTTMAIALRKAMEEAKRKGRA